LNAPSVTLRRLNRLNTLGTRIEFHEIVVSHDAEHGQASALEQACQGSRHVLLRVLDRLKPVRAPEQIPGQDNGLDLMLTPAVSSH
jgi:hypothetical protein